jgi:hypothetical protein
MEPHPLSMRGCFVSCRYAIRYLLLASRGTLTASPWRSRRSSFEPRPEFLPRIGGLSAPSDSTSMPGMQRCGHQVDFHCAAVSRGRQVKDSSQRHDACLPVRLWDGVYPHGAAGATALCLNSRSPCTKLPRLRAQGLVDLAALGPVLESE